MPGPTPTVRTRVRRDKLAAPRDAMEVGSSFSASAYFPVMVQQPPSRCGLRWVAGAEGKPGINADIQNAAESVRMLADRHFEVLGTNGVTASVTYHPEGGLALTTAGASADQVILAPHLDTDQTAWTKWTWGTDRQVIWECTIRAGAAITAQKIWAGLKLTNTPTVATDNDQVFVRYEAGVASGVWQVISSIGGTDTTTSTALTVVLSTVYRIIITINASRVAQVWIGTGDNQPVLLYTTTALTDAIDLIPYIGIEASAVATKTMTVYEQAISRASAA